MANVVPVPEEQSYAARRGTNQIGGRLIESEATFRPGAEWSNNEDALPMGGEMYTFLEG